MSHRRLCLNNSKPQRTFMAVFDLDGLNFMETVNPEIPIWSIDCILLYKYLKISNFISKS